jgi:preprotein translocase subunit SecA
MDQLRQGIHLRSYGQQNPLRDYQNEGHQLFDTMMQNIEEDVSKYNLRLKRALLYQSLLFYLFQDHLLLKQPISRYTY